MEKRVGHVVYVFEIFLNVLPVVVAMSGGVDSSVTAALLAQDVRLIKFQLLTLTG
jgi:tRNA(Ile)-lysidine synthase TilS/MesJ